MDLKTKANLMRHEVNDYLVITFGLLLYALGWTAFLLPYQISTGGLTGISAIVYYMTGIELQNTYFVVNFVFLIFAVKILGFKFCIKTIYAVFALTFFLWGLQRLLRDEAGVLPQLLGEGQDFMACLIGAALCGFGMAQVFLHRGSTGGTDIIAAIVNKYKNVTMGRMILYCDIFIISSCYFLFHDWKRVLFGFVTMIVLSVVIDYVMNYVQQSVQFFIISKKYDQICKAIIEDIDRGATLIDGTGCYSGKPVKIIMVLAKRHQSIDIFRLVKAIDPDAFISQSKVAGVFGEGFDSIKV